MTVATPHLTLSWTAPGPGSWQVTADHYPRPVTTVMRAWPAVWSEATTETMRSLHIPIDRAEMALVNGLPYVAIHAGGGGRTPPPAWLMKLLVQLVPSLRRAQRELTTVIEGRAWLEVARRWYDTERAEAVARQRSFAEIRPEELDPAALASHLRAVHDNVLVSGRQHISMGLTDGLGVGLFVVTCEDWGISPSEAFALLAGWSPASGGQHPELIEVRHALAGRAVSSLDEARCLSSDVATALDSYLIIHGTRVVDGYDVDTATLAERHDLLLHLLNTPAPVDRQRDVAAATAAVRSRVPEDRRAQFDELLDDARRAYGVRDDNNGILVGWAVGLLRRAMLEAGRRIGLEDASLAVEAGIDELLDALDGGLLDADELHRRREYRRSIRASDAPRTLGPPDAPAPAMPGALGTVMRIFGLYEFAVAADRPLRGMGIGTHTYTGRARVLRGGVESVDLDGFEPGDVLVAPMTAPSCNVLLSLAGALVTEEGGIMSHAAMIARELGLPAVLGAARATELINDGATVTVDPGTGSVTIE